MRGLAQRAVVGDRAVSGGILEQRPDHLTTELEGLRVGDHDVDAAYLGTSAHHGDGLRVAALVHQVHPAAALARDRLRQVHRLGGGGGLVEQGGVRDLEPGEIRYHRLEGEQRLEPSLRDLRLVGRVRRVPPRILEHVAQDDAGRHAIVVAHAQVRPEHLVLRRHRAQRRERFLLAGRGGSLQGAPQTDVGGHDGVDEGVQGVVAERRQHRPLVLGAWADVAVSEQVGVHVLGSILARGIGRA